MYVQVGLAESAGHGNVVFNTAALIGPDGVVGVYRKLHNQAEYPFFCPARAPRSSACPPRAPPP